MRTLLMCLLMLALSCLKCEAAMDLDRYLWLIKFLKSDLRHDYNISKLSVELKQNENDIELLVKRGNEYTLKALGYSAGWTQDYDETNNNAPMPINNNDDVYKKEIFDAFEKALNDYNNAIKIDPNNPKAYYSKAIFHEYRNEYDEAIVCISKYIELQPDKPAGYEFRGLIYQKLDSVDSLNKAITDFTSLIKIVPIDSDSYFMRSLAYQRMLWLLYPTVPPKSDNTANKLIDNVISDLNKASKLKNDSKYFYEKAKFYAGLNKPELEMNVYKEISKTFTDDFIAPHAIALKYVERNEDIKSIPFFTKAIDACNKRGPAYLSSCLYYYKERADAHLRLKNVSSAITDFTYICNSNNQHNNGLPPTVFDCSKLNGLKKVKALGNNWVLYFEANNKRFYYDKKNINRKSKDIIKVWELSESAPDVIINERITAGLPSNGFNNYSHTVNLFEISCSKRQISILGSTDYSSNGSVLNTFKYDTFGDKQKFSDIYPNSKSDDLHSMVCKKKIK